MKWLEQKRMQPGFLQALSSSAKKVLAMRDLYHLNDLNLAVTLQWLDHCALSADQRRRVAEAQWPKTFSRFWFRSAGSWSSGKSWKRLGSPGASRFTSLGAQPVVALSGNQCPGALARRSADVFALRQPGAHASRGGNSTRDTRIEHMKHIGGH